MGVERKTPRGRGRGRGVGPFFTSLLKVKSVLRKKKERQRTQERPWTETEGKQQDFWSQSVS